MMYMLEKNLLKHCALIHLAQTTYTPTSLHRCHPSKILHRRYMGKMFCPIILRPSKELSQALQKLLHHFLMPQCQQWHPFTPLLLPTLLPYFQCPLCFLATPVACMFMNTPSMFVPIIMGQNEL